MHKIFRKTRILLLVIPLLSGCSASSFTNLFSNYSQQMYGVKQAQQQGDFQQAISLIPIRSSTDGSYSLGLLEKARLEYLANNNKQSRQDFEQTYKLIQQSQQRAKIELSLGVENVAAVMSNDNAIRYDIPRYEQSMLHSYQALNYLSQQDLSGALVEVRRANLVQESALKANANNIDASQKSIIAQGASMDSLSQQYPSMNRAIGKVKNGFQNAYTFYLSALLYEAADQKNDAYIDYKKALEIYPDNRYLQQDIWRLANTLHMTNDISLYRKSLSQEVTKKSADASNNNQGQVVFIIENGIVGAKQEASLSLPIYTSHGDMRFYSVALPSYQNQLTVYSPLTLTYQGKSYQAEEIVRLQSLAAKKLQDQLPIIVTRQITRIVAKEEIRKKLVKKGGDVGNIFANLYNIVTEKADTRSWSTLPDSIHILRLNLSAGIHTLNIHINGVNQQIEVAINQNKQTLVTLNTIGTYVGQNIFNL
ncbi:COG3014 family protein [Candidatus Colwellia aromaticivorans]|uniref:COG3014 family protein n=1 Tax=Candidatus Colwellia aromaticivorans TaxID=2267621 RepID=UPI001B3537CA|nr:hypothetical protein [Candidatus Colwellia aromaticivorans]